MLKEVALASFIIDSGHKHLIVLTYSTFYYYSNNNLS